MAPRPDDLATGPDLSRGPDLSQEQGLREAWQAHAGELMGYASRVLGERAAAEEAVQETFVRAWRAAATYDRSRPLRPWLFAVLRRVVADEGRSRVRRPRLRLVQEDRDEGTAAAEDVAAPGPLDDVLDEWVLHEALRTLREDHRVVLVETFYRDRTYAAVAQDLGIPEATARTRAFYGLRALRLALEEMGWDR